MHSLLALQIFLVPSTDIVVATVCHGAALSLMLLVQTDTNESDANVSVGSLQ